jgi:hypothetical protein
MRFRSNNELKGLKLFNKNPSQYFLAYMDIIRCHKSYLWRKLLCFLLFLLRSYPSHVFVSLFWWLLSHPSLRNSFGFDGHHLVSKILTLNETAVFSTKIV